MQKHDHELAKALYAKPTTSDEPEKPMNTSEVSSTERREAVMTRLWQRMGEIFGNQWELNFGKPGGPSFTTWTEALAGYSELQIRNGLEQCRTWDNGFVPHLGQFAKLCLTKRDNGPNFTAERLKRDGDVPLAQLTKQRPGDSEITKREKARIRGILAGAEAETKEESYRNLGLHKRWGPL